MFENINKYRKLFRIIYTDKTNLNSALLYIRDNGANQMESVRVVMLELEVSLKEADGIVIRSSVWSDRKDDILDLRDKLERVLHEINISKSK